MPTYVIKTNTDVITMSTALKEDKKHIIRDITLEIYALNQEIKDSLFNLLTIYARNVKNITFKTFGAHINFLPSWLLRLRQNLSNTIITASPVPPKHPANPEYHHESSESEGEDEVDDSDFKAQMVLADILYGSRGRSTFPQPRQSPPTTSRTPATATSSSAAASPYPFYKSSAQPYFIASTPSKRQELLEALKMFEQARNPSSEEPIPEAIEIELDEEPQDYSQFLCLLPMPKKK